MFEKNVEKLEEIAKQLEGGECSVDEAVEYYETAVKIINENIKILDNATRKVTEIKVNMDYTEEIDF